MRNLRLLTVVYAVLFLLSSKGFAQLDALSFQLETAQKSYKSGDFATSILANEKALQLALALNDDVTVKDSLFYVSLKQLITVSGIGKAMDVSERYFNRYKKEIYDHICTSQHQATQIGIINNFVGVAVYNKKAQLAVDAFVMFKELADNCSAFRDVDLVQSAANAAMAYADLNQPDKAIELLPIITYYKDSLPNWKTADYNKVLGYVNDKTNAAPEMVIGYYMNAAKGYTLDKRYAYALNLYESVLRDYGHLLSHDALLELIEKSEQARDSTEYYHNALYTTMTGQLGRVMIDRTVIEEKNNQLKSNVTLLLIGLLSTLIFVLLYLFKQKNDRKNYYKKLYTLEKRFERQTEKLQVLKNNFIKTNYKLDKANNKSNILSLFETLHTDFPELAYNVHKEYENLSEKETHIIYCSLLSLSTKECSDLLNMTHGSFRVAKNRLIKKIGCENADDFYTNIKQLL
ncbi:hypothetical protein ACFSQP_08745 [Bizionia sediminis]|uniref:HTH luxR-type domain-containing protein n=1 Tax=Bizionia sediminis TaxID=1737064 RepID=A0ABW5KSM4_9FLAO